MQQLNFNKERYEVSVNYLSKYDLYSQS